MNRLVYLLRKYLEALTNESPKKNIDDLSDWLELPVVALRMWVYEKPDKYQYESFNIPKKNGRGYRKIDAPNPELKALQRRVYHKLLKSLGIHKSATAYASGKSIVENALPHVHQEIVVNIDLKNFFGSIKENRIRECWGSLGWNFETSTILTNICCYKGCLPQGAPTSPALSNLCNQSLDSRLERLGYKYSGRYTRYSDDLTFSFSSPYALRRGVIKQIHGILFLEGYKIQKKKRIRIQRSHQRQTATGLVVNEKVNLPREVRRRIRSMRHHKRQGTLSTRDLLKLNGYESLLKMIEARNTNQASSKLSNQKQPSNLEPLRFSYNPSLNIKKILFLASSPKNIAKLRSDEEVREISESLRRSEHRDNFQLEQSWAVRADDLRRALLDTKPNFVHFSGHGLGEEGLLIEDGNGLSIPVSTDALASLFSVFSRYVECVLLNACYSEKQASVISQHVDYVVGMNSKISDAAAIKFATGFYDALGSGLTVEQAYALGCQAIQSHGISEHLTPTLKVRTPSP